MELGSGRRRLARRGVVSLEYILLVAFMAIAAMVGLYYFLTNYKLGTVGAGSARWAGSQQRETSGQAVGQHVIDSMNTGH